jgi:hypothetical protein
MNQEKLLFLRNDFLLLLQSLKADARGKWGLMNGQQMVEHFVDAVRNASGKLQLPVIDNGVEQVKMQAFLFSEKPFAQNIRNPYISEQPQPVKQPNIQASIEKLRKELVFFFEAFENDLSLTTVNPFFGELDYKGNVQLLHKHALHHLNQFGLVKQ